MTAVLTGTTLLFSATACTEDAVFSSSVGDETDPAAAGISIPADASIYRSSALGPDRLNVAAEDGSPMSFVDPALLDDDGNLPDGMTITEAQSLQVLEKIEALLADRKLKLYEVATVRVYLAADGEDGVDFEGWQRAYRRYFANIDRDTGRSLLTEPVETTALSSSTAASDSERPQEEDRDADASDTSGTSGSAEPSENPETSATSTRAPVTVSEIYPGTENRTRPTLVTVGVAEQPVEGWLVQVEIEAVHGKD
ncbi:hypothetical protein A606_01675 [Corynebacterium terpenotabidum Y-11]|uniref:Uncharacterized protein n=2 Tax=Corynebacterium terpenotabidum TaxID=89154 RepID=S4XEG7_9CORY|nr:hypothetical protein A606_01675 [Corynebacterium terpenotabidum Y-11]